MSTAITNQCGKYLDGNIYDEILDAYKKDETSLTFKDRKIEILGSRSDGKGNRVIQVKIERITC